METPNLVVVDIDNTVHQADIALNKASQELFGSGFRWDAQSEWYIGGHPDMPMENALKVFNLVHERHYIFLTQPYDGAVEGLQRIADAGFEIGYFTDRKVHARDDTRDWLE